VQSRYIVESSSETVTHPSSAYEADEWNVLLLQTELHQSRTDIDLNKQSNGELTTMNHSVVGHEHTPVHAKTTNPKTQVLRPFGNITWHHEFEVDAVLNTGHVVIFIMGSFLYLILCCLYEIRQVPLQEEPTESTNTKKQRNFRLDAIKGMCLYGVVCEHMCQIWFRQTSIFARGYVGGGLIPIFAMISGIFSASVNRKTLLVTGIGFPCTLIVFDFTYSLMTFVTPGTSFWAFGKSGVIWFLQGLIVWRLISAPLFHRLDKFSVPKIVSWMLVWLISGIWLATQEPIIGFLPWSNIFYYMPFFAFGLLMDVDGWSAVLQNKKLIFAGGMAHQLWYAGLFFDGFRDLAISSCLPLQCRSDYFMPMKLVPFLNAGLSVEFFKVYAFIHLQKAFLIFSGLMNFALWEIVIGFLFDTIVPGLWTHLAKYSENTMYGYLLHWLYLVSGFRVMGVFLDRLIPKPNLSVLGQFFVFLLQNGISVCIYFAVNSKLSAWLFQYLTQIPFWIMSCTGFTQKHQGKEDTKSAQTDCSNQNKSQPNGMSSPCHETSAAKLLQEGRA